MRKGRRKLLVPLGLFLLGTAITAVSAEPSAPDAGVRMTVEIAWALPPNTQIQEGESFPLELELTEGRVLEAIAWPSDTRGGPERAGENMWRLGTARSGRVRARLQAPMSASLSFQAAGQVIHVPLASVLEGPQRTPPQTPVDIGVERLAWDSIQVRLSEGDGTVAPGSRVPVALGFNVLTAEPADVAVRCVAELRPAAGGEPLWRHEIRQGLRSNTAAPPTQTWEVPAPSAEGTYVLELRSNWDAIASTGREGSRLSRLIHRRRTPPASGSAVRRVTMTVIGQKSAQSTPPGSAPSDIDTVDLARLRGNRLVASGRAPLANGGLNVWRIPESALVEPTRRDRMFGWILRSGSEAARLAPADSGGYAWSAVGLKVEHPERPHRLSITVTGGHPSALGVGLIRLGGAAGRPRVMLDACAAGPPILDDGPSVTFSWLVWPSTQEPVLVLVNRGGDAPVRLGTAVLTELPELPAGPNVITPEGLRRELVLSFSGPNALERFGGASAGPVDTLARADHLAQYLSHCGASGVILPEVLADRSTRQSLEGQAGEDATGPDRLGLLLQILSRHGLGTWLDVQLDGALPDLPAPGSAEAATRGLIRVDADGQPEGTVYHPLHADVREAMKRKLTDTVAAWKEKGTIHGILIRLGHGPTLLGGPDTGYDDLTFARFVRDTFEGDAAKSVPGLSSDDPGRFAARGTFLAGAGRGPWLSWRSRSIASLYAELADAVRTASPGTALAVATPVVDDGPAGQEARRVDFAGLAPSHAWRAVGLDLDEWRNGDGAPLVLRGISLSTGGLAHDLATSPDLDVKIMAKSRRGLIVSVEHDAITENALTAVASQAAGRAETTQGRPESSRFELPVLKYDSSRNRAESPSPLAVVGTGLFLSATAMADELAGDEPLGHGLAALDARWVVLSSAAVLGREDRLRRFARVFRALPATSAEGTPTEKSPFGVTVRTVAGEANTYLALANDSPFPIRLETIVAAPESTACDDLGRGLRLAPKVDAAGSHVVLDLLPFGVAAIRVASPRAKVASVNPYPSEAVVSAMRAQYDEMSTQLLRLNQRPAGLPVPPANSGFEPETTRTVTLNIPRGPVPPAGWHLVGGMNGAAEIDPMQVHSGSSSMRFSATAPSVSVASARFVPNVHSALTIRTWLRSEKPDTKVRLWIEGEAAGIPFVRRSDLTAQPDWTPFAVRATDLPPGGLDGARIRFELMAAGTVWIDDLSVAGATMSESEKVNAQRALIVAMKAYEQKRYADFARLAGSHWARYPTLTADADGDPAGAGHTREAASSPLPSDRRLR
jgi:hypothetical protein